MKSLTLIILLLVLSCPALAPAQSSKFFKDKLGKPAELYRHKSVSMYELISMMKGKSVASS
jgi:hypothetical protein